ncbi:CD3324 family protein [Inediibacterium massiliense]|uniref:CD3324 family protein n=1 Tax=Inediibacterium massiliense TaxID=1658111 RepID=UPI0006B46CCC|nr:CD3324 family protein [Inediibacterium massiliense]
MKYKNAKGILPTNLLKEIQQYIQGEFIYIPITGKSKVGWGQKNGTKETMYYRNKEIFDLYKNGYSIDYLVNDYNLSESSIRKIVSKMKKEDEIGDVSVNLGGQSNE